MGSHSHVPTFQAKLAGFTNTRPSFKQHTIVRPNNIPDADPFLHTTMKYHYPLRTESKDNATF